MFEIIYKCNILQNISSLARSWNCEKQLLASSCVFVGLQVCTEQLESHWTNFNDILHWRNFRKCVEKIQVSLKPDKNDVYFTWRPMYINDNTSLNFPYNKKYVKKSCR